MALTVCNEDGCPTLTPNAYCLEHHKARRKVSDARRPSATQRGYTSAWRATRGLYLSTHQLCEHESGCAETATDVDHIDGQGPNGPRGHDHANLRALCHRHHSQRTARDQPGGWAA